MLYFKLIRCHPAAGEYTEMHHIIPKSLGGDNNATNIVKVSGRVHFILHRLLVKMTIDVEHTRKMNCALHFLARRKKIVNSRKFLIARAASSAAMKGRSLSEHTKLLLSKKAKERGQDGIMAASKAAQIANKGRTHTAQSRANMSAAHTGKTFSEGHRAAIGKASAGRVKTQRAIDAFNVRMKEQHPRRKTWILIDPTGHLHKINEMLIFCEQRGLAYSSLRYKAQQQDITPVCSGPSKGWRVFGTSRNIRHEEPIE